MGLVLPLLYILGFSSLIVFISKKRFEDVLAMSIMISTLLVYGIGLFSQISYGVIVVVLLSCLGILIYLYKVSIKDFYSYRKISIGIVLFVIMYLLIYIMNLNRLFGTWDDFSHWGPMVKEMFRLNQFYTVESSKLFLHKDYPPVISLFETIWVFIIGEYKEGYLFRSIQILSLSMLFNGLKHLDLEWNIKGLVKGFSFISVILLIVNVFPLGDAHFYRNIYIDATLGILLAYGFYCAFTYELKWFDTIRLASVLSFMILSKQMGLVYVLIIFGYLVFAQLIQKKRLDIKFSGHFSIIAVSTFLMKFSWDQYIKQFPLSIQFELSDIKLSSLFGIINGQTGETYQIEAAKNYIAALGQIPLINFLLDFNYWTLFLVFAALFFFLFQVTKDKQIRLSVATLSIVYLLGAVAYAFVMLLLYVYSFGFYEGPRLASFVRYMNTYWLAGICLWFLVFVFVQQSEQPKKQSIGLLIVLTSLLLVFTLQDRWIEFKPALLPASGLDEYYDDIEIIQEYTDKIGSVFVVAQKSSGYTTNIIRYHIMPQWVNTSYYSLGDRYHEGDVWTKNIDIISLSKILESYKYVYLYDVDKQFRNLYYDLFENGSHPDNMQLFEIVPNENGLVHLERIY